MSLSLRRNKHTLFGLVLLVLATLLLCDISKIMACSRQREPPRARGDGGVLPPTGQVWAHGVCSVAQLAAALADDKVTAIETDIIMTPAGEAMLAHPPARSSDLSLEHFLATVLGRTTKHIKLDFKDIDAVPKFLGLLQMHGASLRAGGQHIWLNADILGGPGARREDGRGLPLDAHSFLQQLTPLTIDEPTLFHLSLGWRVHVVHSLGYTPDDVAAMAAVMGLYELSEVVFAVNARLAARDTQPIVQLMQNHPLSHVLFWTGVGEPPLSMGTLCVLQAAFGGDLTSRVSFDVRVAQSVLGGWVADAAISLAIGLRALLGPGLSPW